MAWSCEKFKMEEGDDTESNANHVLAVALGNGEIVMMTGHDDVSPVRVVTGMRGNTLAMEWANSRELLAVAGTLVAGKYVLYTYDNVPWTSEATGRLQAGVATW